MIKIFPYMSFQLLKGDIVTIINNNGIYVMTDNITYSINKHSDRLFNFVYRILRDREKALDLVQEIYLKVLSKYENINDKNKLKAYLFRTAYNMALNYKRDDAKHKNRLESGFDDLTPSATDLPDMIFESAEQRGRINTAIEKLAEKQKEVVLHRFYNEMKISEIAEIMKISEGTVKVHLARGLQNMKKHLYNTIGKERL